MQPAAGPALGLSPRLIEILGIAAAVLGGLIVVWLLWRALGNLMDRDRVPRARGTYVAYGLVAAIAFTVAASAWLMGRLLSEHTRVHGTIRLGQLGCESLTGGRVRTTFIPAATPPDAPLESESVEEAATSCRLAASLVVMRGLMGRLGYPALIRVSEIGHTPRVQINPDWLIPGRDGLPGGLLVRDVRDIEATTPPLTKQLLDVMATPDGMTLQPGAP